MISAASLHLKPPPVSLPFLGRQPASRHCGPRRRASRKQVAGVLWLRQSARVTVQMAHHAPRLLRRCPCLHRPEDHGPNVALRAVVAPQIRQPQIRRHASPSDSKSRRHRRRVRVAATCWVTSVTPTVSGVALQLPASFLCRYHSRQIWFSCLPHWPLCGSVAAPRAVPVPQLSSTPLGVVSLPLRHARLLSIICCPRLRRVPQLRHARLPSSGCCPRPWRGCSAAAPCATPFDQLPFPRRQPGPRRN